MKRIATLTLICLAVAAVVWSQSIPRATVGMRIAWDQDAASLADVQAYRYTAYVDGATTGTVIPATCAGTAPPFECATPLPVSTLGDHSVAIAAQQLLGENLWSAESRSESFTFRVVDPAAAPSRLRVFPQ